MEKVILLSKYIYETNFSDLVHQELLCSVSGGQDSIMLLWILLHLQKSLKFKLQILHFNHFWQKDNFYSTYELLKISFLFNIPVNIIIPEIKISSETIGHYWRKQKIYHFSTFLQKNHVLYGHTASDQIETALWNLFRGTSPNGLNSLRKLTKIKNKSQFCEKNFLNSSPRKYKFLKKSIFFYRCHKIRYNQIKSIKPNFSKLNIFIFQKVKYFYEYTLIYNSTKFVNISRPLLYLHRSDIVLAHFNSELNLPICIDQTNQETKYTRNKIRLIIIPLLRYYFQNKSMIYFLYILNTVGIVFFAIEIHQGKCYIFVFLHK